MVTDEDVVNCFRMDTEELNRKVNIWMRDSSRYFVSVVNTRPVDIYNEVIRIRVYQDDYVYLLDVICETGGNWKVIGFCKPNGELTRIEIEMVRLHNLLVNLTSKEPTNPWFADTTSHMSSALEHLETAHRIYATKFCWMTF